MTQASKRLRIVEALIIGVVVLAALLGIYLLNAKPAEPEGSNYAVISVDGTAVEVVRLADYAEAAPAYIDLHEWGVQGKLELKEQKIRFVEVSCPDHICEKQGYIGQELQSAVCMPNRVAVSIYSSEDAKPYLEQIKK